jgi:hypothetical protein
MLTFPNWTRNEKHQILIVTEFRILFNRAAPCVAKNPASGRDRVEQLFLSVDANAFEKPMGGLLLCFEDTFEDNFSAVLL